MTRFEFLALLRATPRRWVLDPCGRIRTDQAMHCPWTKVDANESFSWPNFGLKNLFNAADNVPGHDASLRDDMLEACGLKEAQ